MMKYLSALAACLVLAAGVSRAAPNWDLVWSDEFDKPGSPDPAKWRIQVGPSMVNDELEYYSDRPANLKVADGNLYIIALKENFGGRSYTSGRLDTETKAWWTYGRIEIKAKLPQGKGSWPAFWTLGHECDKHEGWPNCGEIDIAEYAGKNPNVVNTTMHMKDINYKLGNNPHGSKTLSDVGANFHVYALEWYKDRLDIYFDSTKVLTFKDAGKGFGSWPYFNPQYVILNEALGGGYAGPVDNAMFPTQWVIDYVRVYKEGAPTPLLRPMDRGPRARNLLKLDDETLFAVNGRLVRPKSAGPFPVIEAGSRK
ncbi:MAG: glycoside hydrolase family 16 [Fibrobacteres bacterium]|nr:glycoside hydrolase family 16 [Fibrobacterota bacterium]